MHSQQLNRPENAAVRILLLGDSTVMGSVPRVVQPQADHLEQIVTKLLAADVSLPPAHVINRGLDNDWMHQLLGERYDRELRSLEGGQADVILIRYGLNDYHYLKDRESEFPATYHDLLGRLRRDHAGAHIALETVIPYCAPPVTQWINETIRRIAREEGLPICDTHGAYAAALERGPDIRTAPLALIPEKLRPLVPSHCIVGNNVIAMDHALDAHFADVPGWFADRHSNLAGFHVIGKCLAGYLAPVMRERASRHVNRPA